jgi:cytochrome c
MKQAGADGIVWNAENLDKYLTKPKAFIPKNKMTFPGLKKPADRKNVITYLKSLAKQ